MKPLRICGTSDWHLGGGLYRLFPDNSLNKQMHEIEKVFKHCINEDIRYIVCPGDITDKPRMDEEVLISLLTLLVTYNKYIAFHYTKGNHDFAHVGKTATDVLEAIIHSGSLKNVHVYSSPTVIDMDGIDVCFMPYPNTKVPKHFDPMLIFAHIETVGAKGDYGTPLKKGSDKHTLCGLNNMDFVWSGHLHTYQYLKDKRVLYNGALYQKTFGEALPKGFVTAEVRKRNKELYVKHQFINSYPEFKLVDLYVESSQDWNKIQRGDHIFYRIFYAVENTIIPKNLTRDYPNVLQINSNGKFNSIVDGEIAKTSSMPKITPITGLQDFLKRNKQGSKEIRLAIGLVKEALQELKV